MTNTFTFKTYAECMEYASTFNLDTTLLEIDRLDDDTIKLVITTDGE